ncbi:bifunctional aldehyde dehydrogenase/enoyl-CoA hydratase [Klebsiella pneumoniae]|uniref:Bifunctional aldehyde dehydrogenase/enoyl-CoA hydratase n=1 Tax=Klebsiella pneumoniae TaxID=573 RepID=A0A2X1S9D9_KLEPN|nr:bifunctional aldehyde dehydrogenase/enoyl-CoA hydratase [Klebsiella pneumoniae]
MPASGRLSPTTGWKTCALLSRSNRGDTIQVRLTCKRKTVKRQRSADEKATGVVEWAVEIFNQHQQAVALYSILTLVERQQGDFPA